MARILGLVTTLASLSVVSCNANGLRDQTKRRKVFRQLLDTNAQVFLLQETYSTKEDEVDWRSEWATLGGGLMLLSHGDSNSRGTAILFRDSFDPERPLACTLDPEGSFTILPIKINKQIFTLVSVYGPHQNRARFFNHLSEILGSAPNVVLGGDFNVVENTSLERCSRYQLTADQRAGLAALSSLVDAEDLSDAWRAKTPTRKEYTHFRPYGPRRILSGARLDRVYFPRDLNIAQATHLPSISDHLMVFAKINLSKTPETGPGVWRCPDHLFTDAACCEEVETFWAGWITQKHTVQNISLWWDLGKFYFEDILRKHEMRIKHQAQNAVKRLNQQIEDEYAKPDPQNDLICEWEKQRQKHHDTALAHKIHKDDLEILENDEKGNKYFYMRTKIHQQKTSLEEVSVVDADGRTKKVTIKDDILRELRLYYTKLYAEEDTDESLQDELLAHSEARISEASNRLLDTPLTIRDLYIALTSFKNGKTPGQDSLTKEFYVRFWHILGSHLLEVFQYTYDSGNLPETQRNAIISLLFKDGNRADLGNWRPISLLNVD